MRIFLKFFLILFLLIPANSFATNLSFKILSGTAAFDVWPDIRTYLANALSGGSLMYDTNTKITSITAKDFVGNILNGPGSANLTFTGTSSKIALGSTVVNGLVTNNFLTGVQAGLRFIGHFTSGVHAGLGFAIANLTVTATLGKINLTGTMIVGNHPPGAFRADIFYAPIAAQNVVPEPATMTLLSLGALGTAVMRRRAKKSCL